VSMDPNKSFAAALREEAARWLEAWGTQDRHWVVRQLFRLPSGQGMWLAAVMVQHVEDKNEFLGLLVQKAYEQTFEED
jgi:hypothetical protein